MAKRPLVLLLLAVLLFGSSPAYAAAMTIQASWQYWPNIDQYRVDYDPSPILSNTAWYQLYFTASDGSVFTGDYNFAPTGVHYLTCNGTYQLRFYNASNVLIGTTLNMSISSIINPTCSSYADGISGNNTLNAQTTTNPDGSTDITWTADPYATSYDIYKDGVKVGDTTGTSYTASTGGAYSIYAKDANGDTVGQSDLYIKSAGGCDVCEQLRQMLQCPQWPEYMGSLTDAIRDALPPPPDWPSISQMIGDATIGALQDYLGEVPAAPVTDAVYNRIAEPMPSVDPSFAEASALQPSVPPEFNSPQPFDITSGPQIAVVDESQPFDIPQPMDNVPHDSPGVPVYPGDPRNSSNGIKQPDRLALPNATPTRTPSPTTSASVPTPQPVPSAIMPTPNGTAGAGATPLSGGGPGATPSTPTPAPTPT